MFSPNFFPASPASALIWLVIPDQHSVDCANIKSCQSQHYWSPCTLRQFAFDRNGLGGLGICSLHLPPSTPTRTRLWEQQLRLCNISWGTSCTALKRKGVSIRPFLAPSQCRLLVRLGSNPRGFPLSYVLARDEVVAKLMLHCVFDGEWTLHLHLHQHLPSQSAAAPAEGYTKRRQYNGLEVSS